MSQGKVNGILDYLADNAPIVLTQEQYDSLSTSEKEGGKVYYVNDGRSGVEVVNLISSSPAGVVQAYAGSSAPAGWLICDGSAVSRSVYSLLFSAIGTTYGSGNGSTTFNLPDLSFSSAQQRVVNVPFSVSGSGQYNTNLKTIIDNDLPQNYKCIGILGGSTHDVRVFWVGCFYENHNYSVQIVNLSSSTISGTAHVYYLATPTNTKHIISTGKNMLTGMIEDIKDVQVDGTTVCSNGVANIDIDDSIFSSATRSKWEDILDI